METVYIGTGSNLGNSIALCSAVTKRLNSIRGITVDATSDFYYTEPFGMTDQPWFVNAAIKLKTTLSPQKLLKECLNLERWAGRKPTCRWGPRALDMDILLWEHRIIVSEALTIPHPGLHLRRFALMPLCDIAPDIIHPLCGISVRSLLEKVPDNLKVKTLQKYLWRCNA
jgi:2-amino-4-hydroxy-6-hydroxymethyldihydropteridine diphosphokinase